MYPAQRRKGLAAAAGTKGRRVDACGRTVKVRATSGLGGVSKLYGLWETGSWVAEDQSNKDKRYKEKAVNGRRRRWRGSKEKHRAEDGGMGGD
ncbi:hypothetical protein NL676_008857 [Syzygium grande]|nr:hypothetical protein NL676_008857 [Syzygium grande]